MDQLTQKKARRFKFMKMLYEMSDGDTNKIIDLDQIGNNMGLTGLETENTSQYLKNEGLLAYLTLGGGIGITHYGVIEVENALSEPNTPTHYFPAINIINIENMTGSQIQQGTIQSSQTNQYTNFCSVTLEDFLTELKAKKCDLYLTADDENELDSEIKTIEVQSNSVRPKQNIINESLQTIRSILEGTVASIIASELLAKLSLLMQ